MTTTDTSEQLRMVVTRELADSELAWEEREAKLREQDGECLAAFIEGDPNTWLRGSTAGGQLLDTALLPGKPVGWLR